MLAGCYPHTLTTSLKRLVAHRPLAPAKPQHIKLSVARALRAMTTESTNHPLSGLWSPRPLQALYYGPGCVQKHLLSLLPTPTSKAFILTGTSLATKTPLIKKLETLLGAKHHAGTFSNIKQHAPVAELDEATDKVGADASIDTIISVGGGSPIDSAKAISYRLSEKSGEGKFLHHIAVPTTLSAAECTVIAGYTGADGIKTAVVHPRLAVAAILYDAEFAAATPLRLWLATGFRALDHAVESQYQPYATEVPCRAAARQAVAELFALLPRCDAGGGSLTHDPDVLTRCLLAAYLSLGFLGMNFKGGLGLSHSLGYALGSPYGIGHGETSCMTLGHVVKLKVRTGGKETAELLARLLEPAGGRRSGDDVKDAEEVGDRILTLVAELGLARGLRDRGVGEDQVPVIASRALGGQKDGLMYDEVVKLVKGLY